MLDKDSLPCNRWRYEDIGGIVIYTPVKDRWGRQLHPGTVYVASVDELKKSPDFASAPG